VEQDHHLNIGKREKEGCLCTVIGVGRKRIPGGDTTRSKQQRKPQRKRRKAGGKWEEMADQEPSLLRESVPIWPKLLYNDQKRGETGMGTK